MQVGYVGLGAMGGALARRLQLQRTLHVRDLNEAAVAGMVELGAVAVSSGAELARQCDVVMLCLPRSADVRTAILGRGGLAEGLAPGKIIIDQTSGDPAETAALASQLAELGVALLDAPVSGGARGADAGTIAIMVSGSRATFETVQPILRSISPNVDYCGERVGDAQALKLINNVMNAGCRLATLEAVAMGRKMGLSLQTMTEVLSLGSGKNRMSRTHLPAMLARKPPVAFAMSLMLKDVDLATGLGMKCGSPMPISGIVRSLLQIGVNTLGPAAQLDEAVRLIESMAATRIMGEEQ